MAFIKQRFHTKTVCYILELYNTIKLYFKKPIEMKIVVFLFYNISKALNPSIKSRYSNYSSL